MSVNWNPHFITGYGSFSNTTESFNTDRQIEIQSEIPNTQHHSQSVSLGSGQKMSVSNIKSASQPPIITQSVSKHAIARYNAYHNKMIETATKNPAKTIPYDDRFNF